MIKPTEAELEKLRTMFPYYPTRELVPVFGWSDRAIEHQARKLKLRKVSRHVHNRKPIGYTKVGAYGYKLIKTNEGRHVEYHRYLWEQHNGKIPAGHVILFADGNKQNLNIENLVCVSRADLAILNRNQKYGREIAENVLLLTKIKKLCKTK